MPRDYLKPNELMKQLRSKGINIKGKYQKSHLINQGYFHGYKGYRFYKRDSSPLTISDYSEIIALINFDNKLKALFYPHLMFIETALKNNVLTVVLEFANTKQVSSIFDKTLPGKNCAFSNGKTPHERELNKIRIIHMIRGKISEAYSKKNPSIKHYNDNSKDIPIWAVYEIMTMGDFGNYLLNIDKNIRAQVTSKLDISLAADTNANALADSLLTLKDLRNAVAHNNVVFDARFKKNHPGAPLLSWMTDAREIGMSSIDFVHLIDYISLISFYLKKLKVPKPEILKFITSYEKLLNDLSKNVSAQLYNEIVNTHTQGKIALLKNYLK